eukprot:742381-Rhodomonas_salina.1
MATVDDAIHDLFEQQQPVVSAVPEMWANLTGSLPTEGGFPRAEGVQRTWDLCTNMEPGPERMPPTVQVQVNSAHLRNNGAVVSMSEQSNMFDFDDLVYGSNVPQTKKENPLARQSKDASFSTFRPVQTLTHEPMASQCWEQPLTIHPSNCLSVQTQDWAQPSTNHPGVDAQSQSAVAKAVNPQTKKKDRANRQSSSMKPESSDEGGVQPKRRTNKKPVFWSEEEHERFLQALKRFNEGNDEGLGPGVAELLSLTLGTRSVAQIRSHAQKYFARLREERALQQTARQAEQLTEKQL